MVSKIITPERVKNEKAIYLDQCSLVIPVLILDVKLAQIKEKPKIILAKDKMVEMFDEKKRTASPFFTLFLILDEIDNQTVF